MGLVRAFVFGVNARAALAVLAIAVSVSYALVAGAAVSGLHDAQTTLAAGLQETYFVVTRPGFAPFDSDDVADRALTRLAIQRTANATLVVQRGGTEERLLYNNSFVHAGPSTGLRVGAKAPFGNHTVNSTALPLGARPDWFLVTNGTFAANGGGADGVHVVVVGNLTSTRRAELEREGFDVVRAPAALPFYEGGALQLVSGVRATVLASALVVGLLATAFVSMELEANRRSFATLRLYAAGGRIAALVGARGATLLLAGHALALASTAAMLVLLERGGAGRFTMDPDFVQTALGATLLGGLLGLAVPVWRAASRLDVGQLRERTPGRGRPPLLRPLLARGRTVVPLLIASAVLAGSLGVLFGVVAMPGQLFGAEGVEVVTGQSSNPLRGTVSAFLGERLHQVEGFEAASPEIFAPTVLDGRPVMVRGVSWASLLRFESVTVVDGRGLGAGPVEAADTVVGTRLAEVVGIGVGDRLVVPGAYVAATFELRVVGVADAPGLLADELLVPLPLARLMTALGPDDANLIRYRLEPGAIVSGVGPPPLPAELAVVRMRIEPEHPLPEEEAVARLDLINFAPEARTRSLTLRVDGEPQADAWVAVEGHGSAEVSIPFRAPNTGAFLVEVNPSAAVLPRAPPYRFESGGIVLEGDALRVRVLRDPPGVPASDVTVRLDGDEAVTDEDGMATLLAKVPGNRTLVAEGEEGRALGRVLVVAEEDVDRPRLAVLRIAGPTSTYAPWLGSVTLENVGGRFHSGAFPLRVDGHPVNVSDVFLESGDRARVEVTLNLTVGEHRIGDDAMGLDVQIVPGGGSGGTGTTPPPEAKTIDELLQERRERALTRGSPRRDATTAFLGETFDNLNAALTVVVLATVLHTGLVTFVAVHRDVEERAATLGTLAAIGADRGALRRLALRDFAVLGAVAAIVGTWLGLLVALAAADMHVLRGFGHALVPAHGVEFGAQVALAALGTTAVAALYAVERVRGRLVRELLGGGPARAARSPLRELTGGEP